jgi:hypothetical protein
VAGNPLRGANTAAMAYAVAARAEAERRRDLDGLATALGSSVRDIVGAVVAARRRTRLSLYRSGASWFLGKRTRTAGVWDVVQPVAGPFLSPAQGGMTVRVLDAAGAVTLRLDAAAAVRFELRADRAPDGRLPPRRDTAAFEVVLRAESAQRAR